MKQETVTLIIAIWGAVLSTIAIIWSVYRDLTDKGRLRVSCYVGSLVTPGVRIKKGNCLIWNVVNVGRQPVLLTNIGGMFENNTGFIVQTTTPLPKMLSPGEYVLDHMVDFMSLDGKNLKALVAMDSFGRVFKAPRKQLKELQKRMDVERKIES